MSDRRLARRIRLAVWYKSRRGEINPDQARRIREGCKDPAVVKRWRTTLEQPTYGAPWIDTDLKTGINWDRVWTWLMDNWPAILKVLLSLLVFLGEEETK